MDDSEVDVDIEDEDMVFEQLGEEETTQTTLEPWYDEGEEEETPLEQEGRENGARYNYTVYYQEREA